MFLWRFQSITRQLNKYNKINGLINFNVVRSILDQLTANGNSRSNGWQPAKSLSITVRAAIAVGLQRARFSSTLENLLTEQMNYAFIA